MQLPDADDARLMRERMLAGDDTCVGAGSVVTGDLPAGVVAVGSPSRVVRTHEAPAE